jgi:hypothetical protein
MEERRKEEKFRELNHVIVSLISGDETNAGEVIAYNYSENLSPSGAKIRGSILLPVGTEIEIVFELKAADKNVTAKARVKWNKVIVENLYYEAGVEFFDLNEETARAIKDYIAIREKKASLRPFNFNIENPACLPHQPKHRSPKN